MIKAVIFDMDGVIVDSEPMHAKSNVLTLRHFGKDATEEYFYSFVGSTVPKMVETINRDFNLSVTVKGWRDVSEGIRREWINRDGYIVVPYVRDLIERLFNEGFLLAVASNSPISEIQLVLDSLKMEKFFHKVVSGLSVPQPKPAPDIFLKVSKDLNVNPNECLVFEDSGLGSIAAKKAGMFCIGFLNPSSGKQDLSLADVCIDSFKDINSLFVKNLNDHCKSSENLC